MDYLNWLGWWIATVEGDRAVAALAEAVRFLAYAHFTLTAAALLAGVAWMVGGRRR